MYIHVINSLSQQQQQQQQQQQHCREHGTLNGINQVAIYMFPLQTIVIQQNAV